ncbi:MAG: hypothetical protein H7338_04620 [Candidatus Sericytochromatia bacterium]|nr:hypothetical protein [Candidatus Sericytochromatia bacterium]
MAECQSRPPEYRHGTHPDTSDRYANLYDRMHGKKAERITGPLAEIMPGRPTAIEPRHPHDDVQTAGSAQFVWDMAILATVAKRVGMAACRPRAPTRWNPWMKPPERHGDGRQSPQDPDNVVEPAHELPHGSFLAVAVDAPVDWIFRPGCSAPSAGRSVVRPA